MIVERAPLGADHADKQSRESSVRKTSAWHWKVPVPSRSSSQLFRLGEMSFKQIACGKTNTFRASTSVPHGCSL